MTHPFMVDLPVSGTSVSQRLKGKCVLRYCLNNHSIDPWWFLPPFRYVGHSRDESTVLPKRRWKSSNERRFVADCQSTIQSMRRHSGGNQHTQKKKTQADGCRALPQQKVGLNKRYRRAPVHALPPRRPRAKVNRWMKTKRLVRAGGS